MTDPDAQPNAAPDMEVLPEHPTRTSRRDEAVADYRQAMLGRMTPLYQWILLAAVYMVSLAVSGVLLGREIPLLIGVVLAINAAAWWVWSVLRRRDLHFRTLSTLTPVVDRATLSSQVAVLRASFENLLSAISNSVTIEARSNAIAMTMKAADDIMRRGGVTPATASVAGYPPYPEIDRTTMPGNDADYLSVPLHRIEATLTRLDRAVEADVVLSESIAQIAGEVVPPLRSVEATLIG